MYDNVLIGVKGDADDHRAIDLAHRLAFSGTRLTLVHVSVISALASEREGLELEINASGGLVHAFADELALAGAGTRVIREHATSVGAGLQAAVARLNADLLVLGSTVHRGLDRLLEGDDVASTLARARCAVAVAESMARPGWRPVTKIGVAYDGTPDATVAVEHAKRLADSLGAGLTPLYVAEPHIYATGFGMIAYPVEDPESVVAAARKDLGTVAGEEVKVIYGDPSSELARFSGQVDVLVCGSRRQGAVSRLVLGSMALSLSRHACCPLIIAPAPQHATPTARPETTTTAHGG